MIPIKLQYNADIPVALVSSLKRSPSGIERAAIRRED
jgi:hypothetical protein